MPFNLAIIPNVLNCPHCGEYIKDIDLATGFELLVADVLQGKAASARNEGFDVYDSPLYPGMTFQIKYANARVRPEETKTVAGRRNTWRAGNTWTWHEPKAGAADFYILFGVKGDKVWTFALPQTSWLDTSSDTGRGGVIKTVTCKEYSRCGRYMSASKRSRFWRHVIRTWPADLHDRIHYYTKRQPTQQMQLFERRVAYVA